MATQSSTAADVLVIFGITGDLAKKMTFRSLYRLERRQMLQCPIVGVARDEWSAATLRDHARRAIEDTVEKIGEQVFQRFAERLSMISGDFSDPKTYDGAVAFAVTIFEHRDCQHENSPRSPCSSPAVRLCRLPPTGGCSGSRRCWPTPRGPADTVLGIAGAWTRRT